MQGGGGAYGGVADGGQDVDGVQTAQRVHRLQRAAERLVEDVADPRTTAPGG